MGFNIWTLLFLFLAFQSFIVGNIFVWHFSKKEKAHIFIGIILLLFGLTLTEYVLFWTKYQKIFPYFMGISLPFPFAFGPIFYLYFRQLILNKKPQKSDIWHFLPAILAFIYNLPLYLAPASQKIVHLKTELIKGEIFFFQYIVPWLQIVMMLGYGVAIFYLFRQQTLLKEIQKWANYVLCFLLVYILSFASYYILIHFSFFSPAWDYAISFTMATFIAFVAIFAYIQPAIFQGYTLQEVSEVFTKPKYQSNKLSPTLITEITEKLSELMDKEQLFLQNDLNLEKLAQKVGTNKHILSQFLNEHFGFSFFEYINHQRINLAKDLLANTSKQELNVIEIAYQVGFNNKVSFNQAFKKITGLSPTEFRAQK